MVAAVIIMSLGSLYSCRRCRRGRAGAEAAPPDVGVAAATQARDAVLQASTAGTPRTSAGPPAGAPSSARVTAVGDEPPPGPLPVIVIEPDSSLLVGYKLDEPGTPRPAAGMLLARLSMVSQGLASDSGGGMGSEGDSGGEAGAAGDVSAGLLAGGPAGSAEQPSNGEAGGARTRDAAASGE